MSRAATLPLDDKESKGDAPTNVDTDAVDAKRAMEMFQRTVAQFPALRNYSSASSTSSPEPYHRPLERFSTNTFGIPCLRIRDAWLAVLWR